MSGGMPTQTIAEPVADAPARLPDDIVDAAIGWAVKLDYNTPTAAARSAFEQWLRDDPRHALAWQRLGSLRQPFASAAPELLRATLETRAARGRLNRRHAVQLLSLAGLALGTGWAVRERTPWQRLIADASTTVGEQKTLNLTDGSTVVLNTDSAVSTDLTGARRRIVLHRGEILISTGADAGASSKRPFWVHTPFGRLRALGTRFTVRLDDDGARISVQQGAVELHPAAGGSRAVVSPGESRRLTDAGSVPADLRGIAADSWRDGVIAGSNIRLADLLDEISRYRPGRIVCDARVAGLRVSGLYHIRDTDQTLQFLAQTQPVDIRYRTRYWVSVAPVAQR